MLHFTSGQQAAFDRWVDITAQLLQKYGPAFLSTQGEEKKNDKHPVSSATIEICKPLESYIEAA